MSAESAYSLLMKGLALLAEQRAHQAAIVLERARDREPNKGSVREALARAYYGSGRPALARAEFEAALDIDPTNHYAHFGLALCLERSGELATARGHAKLAVVMRPEDENYRRALERIARAS
ncbi:MAG: tetratricopeptide repeat protein [Actinomycetota bacterium]